MPLNLDQFLNVAANRTTSEIYIAGPDHQTTAQTRGSFRSWIVSIFKGDRTRNQRTETAHAFIAALQEKVSAKTSGLGDARQEIKTQYDEDTSHIVDGLRNILADQLNGRRALTADVIRLATDYVDSTLAQADADKDDLLASMNREEAIAHLENTAKQFYGRDSLADIHLNDAAAAAKADATRSAQEAAMESRGLRVANRTPQPPAAEPLMKLLRDYLSAKPEELGVENPDSIINKMGFEKADATLKQLRADIRNIKETCGIAIPLFEKLSKGEAVNPNQWTNEIEPGSEEAKAYLNAFRTLQDQYLGPMQTLEYFMRADMAEMKRERFLDSKELNLNNGDTATSERSVRAILDDFQAGEQLSETDISFLRAASNCRDFNQINQMRPGYQLFSGGGNPSSLMTDALDSVTLVPNGIWQVVTDQADPNPADPKEKEIVYDPSEPNPWALAINQRLISRGDDMLDFKTAQNGLLELLEYAVKSKGDIEVARRMQSEVEPPPKSRHGWKVEARPINQATMRSANEANELERRFSPDNFARGVNRSLKIPEDVTPGRGNAKPGKEYTHGYDDSIDSGRMEAANPSNPPNRGRVDQATSGEIPKSILKQPLTGYQKTLSEVEQLAKRYALDGDFIQSYAEEKGIDLAKFGPNHQELYKTTLFHETKAYATEHPGQFSETVAIKSAKEILTRLDSLSDADAQASLARFAQLRNAGETVLASIVDTDIQGLSQKRESLGKAVINYVDLVNSDGILGDLSRIRAGEKLRGDDLGLAKAIAADIAFSGVDIATQERIFNEALKDDSPLRAAYAAVGAHDSNPAIQNNNALNAVSIELTQGLNFIVQQIGQNANLSPTVVGDAVNSLMQTFGTGKYEDLTSSIEDPNVSPQAKVIFDTLTPYIKEREVLVRNTAEGFDN